MLVSRATTGVGSGTLDVGSRPKKADSATQDYKLPHSLLTGSLKPPLSHKGYILFPISVGLAKMDTPCLHVGWIFLRAETLQVVEIRIFKGSAKQSIVICSNVTDSFSGSNL